MDLAPLKERASAPPPPSGDGAAPGGLAPVIDVTEATFEAEVLQRSMQVPVIVDLWATWCQPCQEELPVLDSYAKQPGAVPVVPVLVDSTEADGLELLARLGVRLPSVHDGADALRRQVKAPVGLPATYFVGADGSVRLITDPPFTAPEQVEKAVR